jgi:hypothetical protein
MSATASVLLRTEYIVITQESGGRIIRYRRTATHFPDLTIAKRNYDEVVATYDRAGRHGRGLLVDSRDALGRNDPAFEKLLLEFRSRALPGFVAHAVLMRTAVGLLQAQRLDRSTRSERPLFLVTDGEDEAIRFLLQHVASASSRGPAT